MSKQRDEKNEPEKKAPESKSEYHFRMRHDWDNLIEDLIQDGIEMGMFDNLRGKGKPLNLDKNLYEADMELANTLLKQNELRPAWISHRLNIVERIDRLRADISRTWRRHEQAFRLAQGEAQRSALTISWDDACKRWQAEVVKINKDIDNFNLRRPSDRLEIFKLRFDEELERAGAPRWLR